MDHVPDWYGPPLPPRVAAQQQQRWQANEGRGVKAEATKRVITKTTRVASNDDGNGNGDKSDGSGDKGGGRVTTRVMATATTVAGDDEGNGDGDELLSFKRSEVN